MMKKMLKYLLNILTNCLTINRLYLEFPHLDDPISLGEVCTALKRMVNGKASGQEEGLENEADELANANADYLASVIHSLLLDF
eukprot:6439317-Ditylum_brightwellii.AAC.1